MKLLNLLFILSILLSCTVSSTQKIDSQVKKDNKSKVSVTLTGDVNSGICINCD